MPVREIAVKKLHVDGATEQELNKFFRKETYVLKTMKALNHPHIIETISVYERGTERCFLFPWATGGNLRQLWNSSPGPQNRRVTSWAWDQIRGLVDGLASLHTHSIRHGDLKPENILIFGKDGISELGTLVIADMGTAKLHAEEMRSRQSQGYITTNRHGTLRYEPPEIELYKPGSISRKYDSWSLGCVLLEFVIWLVYGSAGQARFDSERRAAEPKVDRFWDQDRNGDPVLHPVVRRWINEELPVDLDAVPALRDLVDLVTHRLLVASLKSRAYIQEFDESLQKIGYECSTDPSYLWNRPDKALAESKESSSKVVDKCVGQSLSEWIPSQS